MEKKNLRLQFRGGGEEGWLEGLVNKKDELAFLNARREAFFLLSSSSSFPSLPCIIHVRTSELGWMLGLGCLLSSSRLSHQIFLLLVEARSRRCKESGKKFSSPSATTALQSLAQTKFKGGGR